jgi:hypothetical protein
VGNKRVTKVLLVGMYGEGDGAVAYLNLNLNGFLTLAKLGVGGVGRFVPKLVRISFAAGEEAKQ